MKGKGARWGALPIAFAWSICNKRSGWAAISPRDRRGARARGVR